MLIAKGSHFIMRNRGPHGKGSKGELLVEARVADPAPVTGEVFTCFKDIFQRKISRFRGIEIFRFFVHFCEIMQGFSKAFENILEFFANN